MKITPVKGTNDYLPAQAELRNYLQKKICETYEQAGFQRISTPIIEDIEKGRFSFRLTAPYSEERREAARRSARENKATDRLK